MARLKRKPGRVPPKGSADPASVSSTPESRADLATTHRQGARVDRLSVGLLLAAGVLTAGTARQGLGWTGDALALWSFLALAIGLALWMGVYLVAEATKKPLPDRAHLRRSIRRHSAMFGATTALAACALLYGLDGVGLLRGALSAAFPTLRADVVPRVAATAVWVGSGTAGGLMYLGARRWMREQLAKR